MKNKYTDIDWNKVPKWEINPRIPRYLNFTIKDGWQLSDEPINKNKEVPVD